MTYEDTTSYDSTPPFINELTFEIFSSSLKAEGKNSLDKVRFLKSDLPAKCNVMSYETARGGGLGSRPKKMYGERLGDGVEYHFMKTTPRC